MSSPFPLFLSPLTLQTIAGIAVALKQVADPAFKAYAKQVRANAAAMAQVLFKHGYRLQTDGTENHLILWDLRPIGLTGSKVEKICDAAHITLNKNAVAGDTSALVPGGVRIGASALTSRSMVEADVEVSAGATAQSQSVFPAEVLWTRLNLEPCELEP